MCGRFVLKTPAAKIAEIFQAELLEKFPPHFNVAPGSWIPVVRYDPNKKERFINRLHWGLVPSWSKDRKLQHNTINARAETIGELAAFKSAYKHRRCLIPADGFYEWDRSINPPQPYFFSLVEKVPFAFAGIWESWKLPPGEGPGDTLESCSIVTTEANRYVAKIFNRMPVMVAAKNYDTWLDPKLQDTGNFKTLLKPFPPEKMRGWPVSRMINEEKNNKPNCLKKMKVESVL
ncbi:MAG TPA: SOS response-associated peptidase [bacterium]